MLNEMFYEVSSTPEFDEDTIELSKEIFEEYKNKKILIDCNFEDDKWTITDEYSITGLNFIFDEFNYKRFYEDIFEMDLPKFSDNVKAYVATLLGRYSPGAIRDFLNDIRRLLSTDPNKISKVKDDLFLMNTYMCLNFLYAVPTEKNFELIEDIENQSFNNSSKQRTLAQFDTYFLFDDIMKKFWASDLDEDTRLFYFPIYLWWNLTAIIPLRPREFLVISRDCLGKNNSLTLRRNKLKGRRAKNIQYKIDMDYKLQKLKANDTMYNLIQWYIDKTDKYENNELNTLLVAEPHYKKWERKKIKKSRFYTMQNLNTCLRYFYSEIIEDMFGLKVVEKTVHIEKGEISRINLGDTRHIALINLMLEGGTPELAMELAGHENVETATHYYTNITNLIECKTYNMYRKFINGERKFDFLSVPYALTREKGIRLSNGLICYSKAFADGEITDCIKVAGPHGELGDCRYCSYCRQDGTSYYQGDDFYKERIRRECELLKVAIDAVRKERGCKETVGEIMLRLKAESLSYSRYLEKKAMKEGLENGQKQDN